MILQEDDLNAMSVSIENRSPFLDTDLIKFANNVEFVQITSAGLKESHVHDVDITRESPNYPTNV